MTSAPESTGGFTWVTVGLACIVTALAIGLTVWGVTRAGLGASAPTPVQFHIDLPPETRLPAGFGRLLAISPDGQTVAYAARGPSGDHLYIRRLGQPGSTLIPGTEGANNPFFSPTGEWLVFRTDDDLMRVAVAGGAPFLLCTPCGYSAWGDDGNIILAYFGPS